jgi:hypothetical protein
VHNSLSTKSLAQKKKSSFFSNVILALTKENMFIQEKNIEKVKDAAPFAA